MVRNELERCRRKTKRQVLKCFSKQIERTKHVNREGIVFLYLKRTKRVKRSRCSTDAIKSTVCLNIWYVDNRKKERLFSRNCNLDVGPLLTSLPLSRPDIRTYKVFFFLVFVFYVVFFFSFFNVYIYFTFTSYLYFEIFFLLCLLLSVKTRYGKEGKRLLCNFF